MALLKAGQGGSGGDLGCFLVEVLGKADKACGSGEKGACEVGGVEVKKRTDEETRDWKVDEDHTRTMEC